MSSHVHLVLESGDSSLETWTKSVHSGMARWLNRRFVRLGPVFADRPYAEAVAGSRVPHVLAYVHNNPVRAGLVTWAGDTSWSSHRAYLALEPSAGGLRVSRGLTLCGHDDDAAGRATFDEWVRGCSGREALPSRDLARRAWRAAREAGGTAIELATPQVTENGPCFPVVAVVGAMVTRKREDVTTAAVLAEIRQASGTDARGRSARDHRPSVTRARRAALRVWDLAGRHRIEMARALGIGASAASRLARANPVRAHHELAQLVWHQLALREGV
jgi:hypothetical protein